MNRLLQSYKDEKRGPTLVTIQSPNDLTTLVSQIQLLNGNFFSFIKKLQLHIQSCIAINIHS